MQRQRNPIPASTLCAVFAALAIPLPMQAVSGGGLHACNVENAEGEALLERGGGTPGPLVAYQPVYEGDRVLIEEGQVILRCGAQRLVLKKSDSPFLVERHATPPDRFANVMAWLSGFMSRSDESSQDLSTMQVRGSGVLETTLAEGGRIVAGRSRLAIAWSGSDSLNSLRLFESDGDLQVASTRSPKGTRTILQASRPLVPGPYRLELRDELHQEYVTHFEAVDASTLPRTPRSVAPTGAGDFVGHTLEAAWLASVEQGAYVFEAYQRLAVLAASHGPARAMRDALEIGRRPQLPPSAAGLAVQGLGGEASAWLARPPVARGVSTRAVARAALGLVRGIGSQGERTGVAPPPETLRGGTDWAAVYSAAAPSVAFLALPSGYGSGFVLDSPEWLVTNHHVAEAGSLSPERHWQVNVYFADISPQGVVSPAQTPVAATVYKWDPDLDLALLRLDWGKPPAMEVPTLSLAGDNALRPGQEVAAIGNAGLGLLWSMKPGHVSAIGTISHNHPDLLSFVDRRLRESRLATSRAEDLITLEEFVSHLEQNFQDVIGGETLLIQATAPISSGDSGGPLLGANGKVVGISSWGQGDAMTATSTNYFVHGSEIRRFVASKPERPMLQIERDLWPDWAIHYELSGLPDSGDMNVLFGYNGSSVLCLLAMDLDGAHGLDGFVEGLRTEEISGATLEEVVDERAFDAEFGLIYDDRLQTSYALYDLDNDSQFDLVRIAAEIQSALDGEYRLTADGYERTTDPGPGGLLLSQEQIPEAWRESYRLFLEEFSR